LKKVLKISIFGALISFIFLFVYNQIELHRPLKHYNFDVEADDFYIRNLNFASDYNNTFVTGYHLESKDVSKKFDGVALIVMVNGKQLLSSSQADDPFRLPDANEGVAYYYSHNYAIPNTSLRSDDDLSVELYYTVDGQHKEMTGEVELSKLKKPFEMLNNRRYILQVK
jgi:hypothetical protein